MMADVLPLPLYNTRRIFPIALTGNKRLILVFGEPLGNACTRSASPNQPFKY